MLEIDERVQEIQTAYEQAIKNSYIDPNKIDIERFDQLFPVLLDRILT